MYSTWNAKLILFINSTQLNTHIDMQTSVNYNYTCVHYDLHQRTEALHFVEIFIVFGIWLNKVVNLVVNRCFPFIIHPQWTLHWYAIAIAIAFDFVAIFWSFELGQSTSHKTNPKSSGKVVRDCFQKLIGRKVQICHRIEPLLDCRQWFAALPSSLAADFP